MPALWAEMAVMFSRLADQHGEVMPPTWARRLAALSPDQLRWGLERASRSGKAWVPELPEFLAWCNEEPPGPPAAYQEHRVGRLRGAGVRWSHVCVQVANEFVEQEGAPSFQFVYGEVVRRWQRGEALAAPIRLQLPEPDEAPASPDEARAFLAELKRIAEGGAA